MFSYTARQLNLVFCYQFLFSDNFLNSFKKLKSVRVKKAVLNLLLKLSSGWRPKRAILASGGGSYLEIMKFRVEGLYVMCTVDILKYSKYIQVLRIWDVMTPDDIPKLTKRLDGIFGKYTEEFISLCNEKYLEGYVTFLFFLLVIYFQGSFRVIVLLSLVCVQKFGDAEDLASFYGNHPI